jgi:hypothetical protein
VRVCLLTSIFHCESGALTYAVTVSFAVIFKSVTWNIRDLGMRRITVGSGSEKSDDLDVDGLLSHEKIQFLHCQRMLSL